MSDDDEERRRRGELLAQAAQSARLTPADRAYLREQSALVIAGVDPNWMDRWITRRLVGRASTP